MFAGLVETFGAVLAERRIVGFTSLRWEALAAMEVSADFVGVAALWFATLRETLVIVETTSGSPGTAASGSASFRGAFAAVEVSFKFFRALYGEAA